MAFFNKPARIAGVLLATSFLTACGDISIPTIEMPSFGLGGGDPAPVINRPQPDARGVITYQTYQVMVARPGDTLSVMAARVGLSGEDLARHNGLSLSYTPRAGENIALPRNVGGSITTGPAGWTPDLAIAAVNTSTGAITVTEPSLGIPGEPLRHRVEAGDTAYSIARLYNVSVTALASWNGLGADLAVRQGQQLTIPVPDTSRTVDTSAPITVVAPTVETPVVPVVTPTVTPTPTLVTSLFLKPVSGTIARPYSQQSGSGKNDGIDYDAAAGSNVMAAANGKVALVSESSGPLGTIILIRHEGDLLTIYGRVAGVTVAKGDTVSRGQVIGVVASGADATMHFEVRKGTDSVDPAPYLP